MAFNLKGDVQLPLQVATSCQLWEDKVANLNTCYERNYILDSIEEPRSNMTPKPKKDNIVT